MGSINLQSRFVNGKPYIFEINPRFSGSTPARAGLGVNEVDMAIDSFFLGKNVKKASPKTGMVIMRCFQEVYGKMSDIEKLEKGKSISLAGKIIDYI